MKVNRKVTYRLYPTVKQGTLLGEQLKLHQQLYNACLEQRISAYQKGVSLKFADQCKELTQLRMACFEYRELNAQSEQVTIKRVDLAFQGFYRRLRLRHKKAGFPRFKSIHRYRVGDGDIRVWETDGKLRRGKDGENSSYLALGM